MAYLLQSVVEVPLYSNKVTLSDSGRRRYSVISQPLYDCCSIFVIYRRIRTAED